MMNFDEFCRQLKYSEKEKKQFESSYWWSQVNGIEISIQGNETGIDEKYLKIARLYFENQDKYKEIAIKHLKCTLKFDYEYYCHAVCFHGYGYGMHNSRVKEGGFEMLFWQEKPDDDRYVNYVVQFNNGGCIVGLRIFAN